MLFWNESVVLVHKVGVVVIDSRSEKHPDWVNTCVNSIKNQSYKNIEIVLCKNLDRSYTIGKLWNDAVRRLSDCGWILFVGDDDWISRDYVQTLLSYTSEDCVGVSTFMMAYRDGKTYELRRPPTGMFKRSYLLKHPFNEELKKGIDREYLEELSKRGDKYIVLPHHFGYFYRQHDDPRCAGNIDINDKVEDIYTLAKYPAFADKVMRGLGRKFYLETTGFKPRLAKDAKLIWCDWADQDAIAVNDFNTEAPKILRVHAYDAFSQYINYLNFDRFKAVIFVADHIREYVERKKKIPNAITIPNGVDLDEWTLKNTQSNNKIAWAGNLDQKKGIQMLLFLAENTPDFEFIVAGKATQPDMMEYVEKMKPDNVKIEPYNYTMNGFFQDKTYVLNTSPREGCPLTVLEGMACGLKPVVYNWYGADKYLPGFTFRDLPGFWKQLGHPTPRAMREFVDDNYNYKDQIKAINELLKRN